MSSTSVGIIGGADGPTSVFIAGRKPGSKPSGKVMRARRRKEKLLNRAARRIKPCPHTMKQVAEFVEKRYGAAALAPDNRQWQTEYRNLKINLIDSMRPDLAGERADFRNVDWQDREQVKKFMEESRLREERIMTVPEEVFSVNMICYLIPVSVGSASGHVMLTMEEQYDVFRLSAQWSGRSGRIRRKVGRIQKEVYNYYGVTEEDIRRKSMRFQSMVLADKW